MDGAKECVSFRNRNKRDTMRNTLHRGNAMKEQKIDNNIPVPAARSKYNFSNLGVGDSIFFEGLGHDSNPVAAAKIFARRSGKKITVRKVQGGIRIWRIG